MHPLERAQDQAMGMGTPDLGNGKEKAHNPCTKIQEDILR